MSSYLFNPEGLVSLARYVAPNTVFVFDLDGTLAPIVEDYSAAKVSEPVKVIMERLLNLAKVAVITGRSRKDALGILGFEPHLLVGNHGADWRIHDDSRNWQFVERCLKWRELLHHNLFYEQGVEIEFKGESLAIHYRKAGDPEKALSVINAIAEKLEPCPKIFGGKFVVNIVPMEAFGKGDAISAAMERLGSVKAVFFGDDETDEEVFRLKRDDIFGVHVGKDDWTSAQYYLEQQSEMLGLLNSIVGILESHNEAGYEEG